MLTQEQMDHVQAYIEEGHPSLLLIDPLPVVNIGLSPSEDPRAQQNPFMAQNQPPPPPKGDVQTFLADLGVRWDSSAVTWDAYNPHPDLAHLPPEVVFVGEGSESAAPFNPAICPDILDFSARVVSSQRARSSDGRVENQRPRGG